MYQSRIPVKSGVINKLKMRIQTLHPGDMVASYSRDFNFSAICIKFWKNIQMGSGWSRKLNGRGMNKNLAIANTSLVRCAWWWWNAGYRSLKVVETCAIWKLECGFLFAFCINYARL